MYTSWIRVKDRIMGMDSKYILCCCSWFCWFPTVSSFRLTLHRPPPPGGQCQMQSLSTQTSGGCTCGLPMSQVTKRSQKTSFKKTGVLTERNWELGFPASFANLAPDPRTSSPPLTQGSIICWIWHISQHKQFWKYHLDQGWQKFQAPFGRLEVLWL